jgi:hypothetical protein
MPRRKRTKDVRRRTRSGSQERLRSAQSAREASEAGDPLAPGRERLLVLVIAAVALGIPLWILQVRGSVLVWDAEGYRGMADRMLDHGFLAGANPYRTYGYPLFVAVGESVVGRRIALIPYAVVALQMLLLLAAAAFAAGRLAPAWRPRTKPLLFAAVALHPFVLPQAAEQLTELLGAALLLVSAVLLLPRRALEPERLAPLAEPIGAGRAFAGLLAAGASVAVRPANAAFLIALGGLLALRCLLRRLPLRVLLAGALGALLPLLPQFVSNTRAFDRTTPLVVERLYGFHLVEGTRLLKYTTSIAPGTNPHVGYANPLHDPTVAGPAEFLRRRPIRYLATLALHGFALFDWDLLFSYNRTLAPATRWLSTPFGFVALFLAGVGLLPTVRAARDRESARWTLAVLAAACGSIVALYAPTVVESRFSLPVYLLLAPWSAAGAMSLWIRWRERRLRRPGRLLAMLVLLIAVSLGVSLWIAGHARMLPA